MFLAQRVEPPPWVIPGPPDSVAEAALQKISPDLELRFNTRLQLFEVWNSGGMVQRVTHPRTGGYIEPGVWLAAQLLVPMELQIRRIDEANRRLEERRRKQRQLDLEAMTTDRWWQKGFVAALTGQFSHIDKVFGWRKGKSDP